MLDRIEHIAAISHYWDVVGARYLELFRDEFDGKPGDKRMITRFAADLGAGAKVCDAGCGPCGHVTRLLADADVDAMGVDLSPVCVALARQEQPGLRFEAMDMGRMTFADGAFQGLVSYYALHYLPQSSLSGVIAEFTRVLASGGRLLLVVKQGTQDGWIDDPMGSGEKTYWREFQPAELVALAAANGFAEIQCEVRAALPDEIAVPRIYLTARRS